MDEEFVFHCTQDFSEDAMEVINGDDSSELNHLARNAADRADIERMAKITREALSLGIRLHFVRHTG